MSHVVLSASPRNHTSGADEGLQGKLLAEEQKLRRTRARRLIVETNRRRRALEDKQKQRDLREQQLREQVLQLRRQRIQEATERFQKAHLQPQRPRKNIPTIQEALEEIKSNLNARRSVVCPPSAWPGPAPPAVQTTHRRVSGDAEPQDLTHNQRPALWQPPDGPLVKDSLENPPSFFLFDPHVDNGLAASPSFLVRRSPQRMPEDSEELHNQNWKPDPQPCLDKQHVPDAGLSDAALHAIKAVCGEPECCGSAHQPVLDSKQQAGHDDILSPASVGPGLPPNIELSHSSCDNNSREPAREASPEAGPENDLNRLSSFANEKPIYKTLLQRTHAADRVRCGAGGEGARPETTPTCDPGRGDPFMKGILKQQLRRFCDSGDVVFKQVALAIRDSVELTRARARDRAGLDSGTKKLRWFDQGPEDRQMTCHSSLSPDHRAASVPGAPRHGRGITARDHFTKQAWADVGVQVNLPQESAGEVKVHPRAARTHDPAVPWRERGARARAGSVTLRTRKGIVMRPQSAAEASRIAEAQGKMIAPRPPPPRTEDRTPSGSASAGVDRQQDDAPHMTGTDCPNSLAPSANVESPAKVRPRSLHAEGHVAVSGGRSVCLDCTPTEDQISELWHSVRSALASQNDPVALRVPGRERSRPPSGHRSSCPPRSSQLTREAADASGARANTRLTQEGAPGTCGGRPSAPHDRPQRSTLSLEEERILLSLERLDQRLHRERR